MENIIQIEAINTPAALVRVIEVIQRHRVYIQKIVAEESVDDKDIGLISITVSADEDKTRLLKLQCERVVEVFAVN
jgi:acetolactate synthase regulatory subunit